MPSWTETFGALSRALAIGLVVVGLRAPAASGQVNNDFRLDLSFAIRTGDPTTQLEDIVGPAVIQPGQTVRVELRYRIADLKADNIGSRGLSAAPINVRNSVGPLAGMVQRSLLTAAQADRRTNGDALSDPVRNPDASGDGFVHGAMDPFRGFDGDDAPFNGYQAAPDGNHSVGLGLTMNPNGFTFIPVALSAPEQWSFLGLNPSAGNTDTNPTVWALYSFDYTAALDFTGDVTFSARTLPDPGTGARFGYFIKNGTANSPTPVTSTQATDAYITVTVAAVPAPSAGLLAVLACGAVRRRRTHVKAVGVGEDRAPGT